MAELLGLVRSAPGPGLDGMALRPYFEKGKNSILGSRTEPSTDPQSGEGFSMRSTLLSGVLLLAVLASIVPAAGEPEPPAYPPTRRAEQVDRYHDTEVADPYRWLEADLRQSKE